MAASGSRRNVWRTGPVRCRPPEGAGSRRAAYARVVHHSKGIYRGQFANFVVADDGTAWLANGRMTWGGDHAARPDGPPPPCDGERWEVVDLPVEGRIHAGPLALGPDGTLWVYAMDMLAENVPSQNYLLASMPMGGRSTQAEQARGLTLDEADGVPMLSTQFYYEVSHGGRP